MNGTPPNIIYDARPTLSGVRDQGSRPTCLSHALSLSHEVARVSATQLSPEYLHRVSGPLGVGRLVPDVTAALRQDGQPAETDCPYCVPAADPWTAPTGVGLYRRNSDAVSPSFAEIADAVNNGAAPTLVISVPTVFYNPQSPFILDSGGGTTHGLHAIVAVGLGSHAGDELLLIRNSWGMGWADNGHAWLTETFVHAHLRGMVLVTDEATL